MTCIGTFAATPDGFEGRLQTLTIDAPLTLVAIASFRSLSPSNRSPHSMPTWKVHLRRRPSARETSMAIGPNGLEACFAGRRSQAI